MKWKTRGILFDFDGVIADSMGQHLEAWQHSFQSEGITIDDIEFYKLEGRGVEGVVKALAAKYTLSEERMQTIMKRKMKYYNDRMRITFFDGLHELLASLKKTEIRLAVVTGGTHDRIDHVIEKYFPDTFSAIVTSDDVRETKPSPEPYLTGAKRIGLEPEDCIVIENAPLGITAAVKAGIRVIAIETTLPASYLNEADIILKSFYDIQQLLKSDNREMI